MGKGDIRSKKGKRTAGSYGISRQHSSGNSSLAEIEVLKAAPKKKKPAAKKPAAKKPAAKKPAAKKPAAKKEATKKEATKKEA